MINRYYEEELRYLHEAGKEFAQAHPDRAQFLNIESVADRDPYVERLFEGFAFLAARIRERLEDDLPEFTEALFGLLWPQYLRQIPSLAILEFKPRPGLVQQTTILPAGSEVRSDPVGEEGVLCRFRTTQAVRLQPMKLSDAQLSWQPDGTTVASLRITLEPGVEFGKLDLAPLRLYFHAEDTVASLMHLFFTTRVARVTYAAGGVKATLNGQQWIRPAGLGEDEGLVPYSPFSFTGCRLLQEYLTYRRKFWFVDLLGLEQLHPPQKTGEFEVQVFFDRSYPEDKRFKAENLRLFCTPVVNLFHADGEPVRVDHLSSEYHIFADARHPTSVQIYSLDNVVGTEEGTGERHTYEPFFSFRHANEKAGRHFTATSRIGPSDRVETYITTGGYDLGRETLAPEVLSLELTCTNGSLPREKVHERMITQPSPEFPNVATFENLTQPTLSLLPPHLRSDNSAQESRNYLWKLASLLSFNHMSVANAEVLRGLLYLYDWTGTDANRRRIAGIREARWAPKEIIRNGAVLRGSQVTVTVEDGYFADEGDLNLFGMVLSRFFSLYATVNSFAHLEIITKPSERRYQWQPSRGEAPTL